MIALNRKTALGFMVIVIGLVAATAALNWDGVVNSSHEEQEEDLENSEFVRGEQIVDSNATHLLIAEFNTTHVWYKIVERCGYSEDCFQLGGIEVIDESPGDSDE